MITNNFAPNDLLPSTHYEFYLRAACESADSEWVGPIDFTTLCTSFTTPFKETFDTSSVTEDCWRIVNSNDDGKTTWNLDVTVQPIEGDQMSGIFSGSNGKNDDWMISPTITIKPNQRLRYLYRVKDNFFTEDLKIKLSTNGIELDQFTTTLYENSIYTTTTNMGVVEGSPIISIASVQGVKIGDLVETPGVQNGTPIIAIDASNLTITLAANAFNTWEAGQNIAFTHEVINNIAVKEKIINFPSGVTGNVNVAFQIPFYPSTNNYKGQLLFIDNFTVEDIPACAPPSNVVAKDIVDTNVKISWDVNGTENAWEISVQPFGTSAPVGNTSPEYLYTAGTNPYTVTGLVAATKYQYYVRSICSGTVQSEWVGPFDFTTKCSFENLCEYTITLSNDNSFGVGGGINVIQNGVLVQTLEFPTGPWNEIPAPIDYTLFLCSGVEYSLFWDSIGTAPDQYPGAQVAIKNALGETVWTGPLGLGKPRTTLYTGIPICGPITCPQPTNLAVSDKSVFSWTAGGTETQWEVFVQPVGNGTLPQSGIIVDSPSYTPQASDFNSQTASTFEYLVRAICSENDKSYWSGPKGFVRNDDASKSIQLEVNPNEQCNVSASNVTFVGSTPSPEPMSCSGNSGAGLNGGDIWFEFKATSKVHIIEANGFTGNFYRDSGDEPYPNIIMTLYKVDANGNLEEKACSTNNVIVAMYSSELVVGETYKVRLTLNSLTPSTRLFNVCIKTPLDLCSVNAVNYDFEEPPMQEVTGVTTISTQYVVPGWRVNLDTWEELFFSEALNSINFVPYSGGQCIQLLSDPEENWDATDPNIKGLYKEFDTSESTQMDYSFAHATRSEGNVIQLYAGPPQGPFVLIREEPAVGLGWSFVTGKYNVPSGQTVTRFIFRVKGNKIGTLLDAANFIANNEIKTLPTTLSCSQTSTLVEAEGVGAWSADDNNPSSTLIASPNSKSTTISGFTNAGVYTYYWKTRYCEKSITITYQKITETPVVVSPVLYCNNEVASPLTASVPSGYSLLWYTQATGGTGSAVAPTPDTSVVATTSNYVSLVDANGCEGPRVEIAVQVNPLPIVGISGTATICAGATATITFTGTPAATVTYTFNGSNQTIALDAAGTATIISGIAGTYTLVSATSAGTKTCSQNQSGSAIITVTPSTTPNVVFSYVETCANSAVIPLPVLSTNFTVGGVFSSTTLTVNSTTGAVSLSTASAGTHKVVYTLAADIANCIAGASYSADIILTPVITPIATFSYDDGYCSGAANALPTTSPGFYQGGSFSSTNGLVINSSTGEINVSASTIGTYTISYKVLADPSTCNVGGTSNFTTTISLATAVAIEDVCQDQALVLKVVPDSDAASYTWRDANGVIAGSTTSTLNIDEYFAQHSSASLPLNFSVSVALGGCDNLANFTVENNPCQLIPRGISPNNDGSNDTFDLTGLGVRKLIIFNRYGTEVYTFKGNYSEQWNGLSNAGNELPDGTYFYSIEKNNGTTVTGWVYINREH